jgi:predicted Zn finger-like uncharacterized protein
MNRANKATCPRRAPDGAGWRPPDRGQPLQRGSGRATLHADKEPVPPAMKIVCPACASQYELDAAKLGPDGRKVRCAACKTLWHVVATPELPEPPSAEEMQAMLSEELERASLDAPEPDAPEPEPLPEAPPAQAAPASPSPRGRRGKARNRKIAARPARERLRGAAIPLAICAAGILVLGLATWQRDLTVRAAPQLASVFERLGLSVNTRGLTLTSVESGLVDDGHGRFLVVEGDVTNIARGVTAMPAIEVLVKDAAGQTLYTWTTDPPRPALEPAELVRFRARLAQPPENGRSVQVRFTSTRTAGVAAAR